MPRALRDERMLMRVFDIRRRFRHIITLTTLDLRAPAALRASAMLCIMPAAPCLQADARFASRVERACYDLVIIADYMPLMTPLSLDSAITLDHRHFTITRARYAMPMLMPAPIRYDDDYAAS